MKNDAELDSQKQVRVTEQFHQQKKRSLGKQEITRVSAVGEEKNTIFFSSFFILFTCGFFI